jgi:hypothetical protein
MKEQMEDQQQRSDLPPAVGEDQTKYVERQTDYGQEATGVYTQETENESPSSSSEQWKALDDRIDSYQAQKTRAERVQELIYDYWENLQPEHREHEEWVRNYNRKWVPLMNLASAASNLFTPVLLALVLWRVWVR